MLKNQKILIAAFRKWRTKWGIGRFQLAPDMITGLDDVKRPYEAITRLHDALLPFATPYEQKASRNLPAYQHQQGIVWLVTTGNLTFYRAHDDLKIMTSKGPILTGLAEIFQPLGRTYYRILAVPESHGSAAMKPERYLMRSLYGAMWLRF
jgi:hypothetical protein